MTEQAERLLGRHHRHLLNAEFATGCPASQHRDRKLRDVAAEIIKQISGEDPPPAPEFATPRPRS